MLINKLAQFLYEVGSLRKIARSHRQSFMTDDLSDNISSHSYRVSVIGYFLAQKEQAEVDKVLTMCLFHDVGETRSGDQNWVHKKYVKVFDDEILTDQLEGLPQGHDLLTLMHEYGKRDSLEAKITKDADLLDQMLLVKEYAMRGNKEAERWAKSYKPDIFSCLSAKELYQQIMQTDPGDWWKKLYTDKRR